MGKEYTFIDFCSGIGGGRLGLEKNGLRCLGYSEIDKDAIETYKLFYGENEKNYGNVMNIQTDELPDFDIMIGGFPCQSYSIVGLRKGLEDENGQIILGLLKILKEKQPKYFILENVKGLVNINDGESIRFIIGELRKTNYNVTWKVLDSIDFGVPQMRERVYFIGIRKDIDIVYNWDAVESEKSKTTLSKFLIGKNNKVLNHKTDTTFNKYLNNKYNKGKYDIDEIIKNDYMVIDTRQSDLRIYKDKIPTLRAGRHGILYVKNRELKKLSSMEALLLQGFKKALAEKAESTFTEGKLLKQAGNAMTVNVIDALVKSLLDEDIEYEKFSQIRFTNC